MADGKDSFKFEAKSSATQQNLSFMTQAILRILVILCSLHLQLQSWSLTAKRFFVAADAIVCGSSMPTLIITFLLMRHSKSQLRNCYFLIFLHDIVMTVLIVSGCAAATGRGYVGEYREARAGWQGKFCRRGLVSLLLSYLAFFAYLGLTIFTAYNYNLNLMSSSAPEQ